MERLQAACAEAAAWECRIPGGGGGGPGGAAPYCKGSGDCAWLGGVCTPVAADGPAFGLRLACRPGTRPARPNPRAQPTRGGRDGTNTGLFAGRRGTRGGGWLVDDKSAAPMSARISHRRTSQLGLDPSAVDMTRALSAPG